MALKETYLLSDLHAVSCFSFVHQVEKVFLFFKAAFNEITRKKSQIHASEKDSTGNV